MHITLLSWTPDALNLLLRTKGTRLSHSSDPATWTEAQRLDHLAYMRDTIKSSWEFVDYTFQIEGVTRAFTHQLVRTRSGSYAQQAMRVVDARDFAVMVPPILMELELDSETGPPYLDVWREAVSSSMDAYEMMVDIGVPVQDARGILPTNVETNIIAKFNLRTLSDMAKLRLCTRTQGEYQNVFREMKRLVVEAHPWAAEFIEVQCVANGTCAFPRYGQAECPVYPAIAQVEVLIKKNRAEVRKVFESVRYEARPMASGGKAM